MYAQRSPQRRAAANSSSWFIHQRRLARIAHCHRSGSTSGRSSDQRRQLGAETADSIRIKVSPSSLIVNFDGWPQSARDREAAIRAFAAAVRLNAFDVRSLATTLGLAYLAEGRIAGDILFSTPALHCDAGALLAAEARGVVTAISGEPWTLDSDLIAVGGDTRPFRYARGIHDEAELTNCGLGVQNGRRPARKGQRVRHRLKALATQTQQRKRVQVG